MIAGSYALLNAIFNEDSRSYSARIEVNPKSTRPYWDYSLYNEDVVAGGIEIESIASDEDTFSLGKCVLRRAVITLIDKSDYDGYDFTGKQLNLYFGINQSFTFFGVFFVDTVEYDGPNIRLSCYDAVKRLDAAFSGVTYPITAYNLFGEIATMLGYTDIDDAFLLTTDQETELQGITFPFVPNDSDLTCREIMEYALQTIGYNLRTIPYDDKFALSWCDVSITDGKNPPDEYTAQGWGFHLFRYLFSLNMSKQDIQISGIKVIYNDPTAQSLVNSVHKYIPETMNPLPHFVFRVENNPLVTPDNAGDICTRLFAKIGGMQFRKASFTHVEYPGIEAGDIGLVVDHNGDRHTVIVAGTKFKVQNRQSTYSGANNPFQNSTLGYSDRTSTVKEAYDLSKVHSDANASSIAELQGEGLWQTQTCTYAYTCAASGSANVTKANLGVSVPTGYKIAGYTSISTANADVVPRSWNSNSTTTGTSIVLRNLTNTQKTGTLTVVVLYLKTSHEAT